MRVMDPIITDAELESMAAERAQAMYDDINARAHKMLQGMLLLNGGEEQKPAPKRRVDTSKDDDDEEMEMEPAPKRRECDEDEKRLLAQVRAAFKRHIFQRMRLTNKAQMLTWMAANYPSMVDNVAFVDKVHQSQYYVRRYHNNKEKDASGLIGLIKLVDEA